MGSKLRAMRKSYRNTLTQVAQAISVTPSYLSKLERDKASASLGTLKKLADYFGVPIVHFFESSQARDDCIVRRGCGRRLHLARPETPGVTVELISPDLDRAMEALITTLKPGAGSKTLYAHAGEEWNFVVKGTLTYYLGDQEFVLQEFDTIYHRSNIPHGFKNSGKGECVYITVVTPPTF